MTTYIVLKTNAEGKLAFMGEAEANGPKQAIRKMGNFSLVDPTHGDVWHAVPQRNWTSVRVAVEVAAPRITYTEVDADIAVVEASVAESAATFDD